MAQTIIHAYAKHHRVEIAEMVLVVAEVDGFQRASRRIVPGIEIKYYVADAAIAAQTHDIHVAIGQVEGGGGLTYTEHEQLRSHSDWILTDFKRVNAGRDLACGR